MTVLWSRNKIINGNFEVGGTSGWDVSDELLVVAVNGGPGTSTKCLEIPSPSWAYQEINIENLSNAKLSFDYLPEFDADTSYTDSPAIVWFGPYFADNTSDLTVIPCRVNDESGVS